MRSLLLPLLLVSGLLAGEAPPIATLDLASGERLQAHWQANLLGRVLADPALAELRAMIDQGMQKLEGDLGCPPGELLAAMKFLHAEMLLPTKADPRPEDFGIQLQTDLGPQAERIFSLVRNQRGEVTEPASVPGADEALRRERDGSGFARFGSLLLIAKPFPVGRPAAPAPANADLSFTFALDRMLKPMSAQLLRGKHGAERAGAKATLALMLDRGAPVEIRIDLVPEGILERTRQACPLPELKAADPAMLDRLPANTLMAMAVGLDGKGLWGTIGRFFDQARESAPPGLDPLAEAEKELSALGYTLGLKALVEGLDGSLLIAVTPGMPAPCLTIALPRSAALDQFLAAVMKDGPKIDLPAEGESALIPIPNLPIPVSLTRAKGHWLLSSDAMLASTWIAGTPGGFAANKACSLAIEKAGKGAVIIGASDTPKVLATILGFAGFIPDPQAKKQVLNFLAKAMKLCGTGYLVLRADAKGWESEGRGIFGGGCFTGALVAAIAIPNMIESRVTANEAATAATLKAGISLAQVMFSGSVNQDADADNQGEYGLLAELTGLKACTGAEKGRLNFVSGPLAQGDGTSFIANGYRYAIYLPDGRGGAISDADRSDDLPREDAVAANQQERYWVCYAWPVSRETGHKVFAIDQQGQVFFQPWNGEAPAWNALYAGKGLGNQPVWPLYRR